MAERDMEMREAAKEYSVFNQHEQVTSVRFAP
jgi:hypothetical protein